MRPRIPMRFAQLPTGSMRPRIPMRFAQLPTGSMRPRIPMRFAQLTTGSMRPRIPMRFAQLSTGSMRPRPLGARCASSKSTGRRAVPWNLPPLFSPTLSFADRRRCVDFGPPFRVGGQAGRKHQPAEIVKGPHVDPPLEIDDLAHRRPIVGPAPAIKFGRGGGIESQLRFVGDELEQKPALLLPDAAVADVLPRQAIAQPAAGGAQYLHVLAFQADFLLEFAKQRLLHPLAAVDAALGKLPTAPADAAAQEHFPGPARQHNAHIGAKTVLV